MRSARAGHRLGCNRLQSAGLWPMLADLGILPITLGPDHATHRGTLATRAHHRQPSFSRVQIAANGTARGNLRGRGRSHVTTGAACRSRQGSPARRTRQGLGVVVGADGWPGCFAPHKRGGGPIGQRGNTARGGASACRSAAWFRHHSSRVRLTTPHGPAEVPHTGTGAPIDPGRSAHPPPESSQETPMDSTSPGLEEAETQRGQRRQLRGDRRARRRGRRAGQQEPHGSRTRLFLGHLEGVRRSCQSGGVRHGPELDVADCWVARGPEALQVTHGPVARHQRGCAGSPARLPVHPRPGGRRPVIDEARDIKAARPT
jgi:hypothetical protein